MSDDIKDKIEDVLEDAVEELKEEYADAIGYLKRERDELKLQVHLAGLEAGDQWTKAESKWALFHTQAAKVNEATVESAKEVGAAARVVGDELKDAFRHIRDTLQNKA